MRKLWSTVAIAMLSLAPLSASAETLTDALISAYRNSQLLEQNQAILRAADEDLAQAVGSLRPVLSWEASIDARGAYYPAEVPGGFGGGGFVATIPRGQTDYTTASTLGLVASLTLWDFGRGELSIDLRDALVRASQHSLINVEQGVLLDAVSAYVNFALQEQLVAAQEANVRLITQDLRAANDRFEVGEVTRTDVALAEAQLASARSALAAAEGDYNIAREGYRASIGNYPGRLSGLPKMPVTATSLPAARTIAMRTHPAILRAQEQAKAQNIAIEIARANMLPSVSGSARLTQTFTGDGGGAVFSGGSTGPIAESLSIGLSQTIYQGGQLSSQLRKSIDGSQLFHAILLQTGFVVGTAV
ncbi:MAG: TolC family protein, partial [Candidatus Saccharibacteria bacterium]|nr:TolC family protein [Pseudorhodobacter sp.]